MSLDIQFSVPHEASSEGNFSLELMWLCCDKLCAIWIKHFLHNICSVSSSFIWDRKSYLAKGCVFEVSFRLSPVYIHIYAHICTHASQTQKFSYQFYQTVFHLPMWFDFTISVPLENRLLNLCMDRYLQKFKCMQRGFYQRRADICTQRYTLPRTVATQNLHPTSSHPPWIFHIAEIGI